MRRNTKKSEMSFFFKTRLEQRALAVSPRPLAGYAITYISVDACNYMSGGLSPSTVFIQFPFRGSRGRKREREERDVSTHHQPQPKCLCLPFLNISPHHAHLSFHPSILSHLHQLSITSLSSLTLWTYRHSHSPAFVAPSSRISSLHTHITRIFRAPQPHLIYLHDELFQKR